MEEQEEKMKHQKTNKQTRIRRIIRWDRDERARMCLCVVMRNENTYGCVCLHWLDEMYSEDEKEEEEEEEEHQSHVWLLLSFLKWEWFLTHTVSTKKNLRNKQTKHTSMKRKHRCGYEANKEKLEKSTRACITIRRFLIFLFAWRYECCCCCCRCSCCCCCCCSWW